MPDRAPDKHSAPSTHSEIETKFDAEAGFVLPDLLDLPGVATVDTGTGTGDATGDGGNNGTGGALELDAAYLDDDDLSLARHGITLRRRTGGNDAGWHLKLPTPGDERLEVSEPLDGDPHTVPQSLQGLVRARLRGAPLVQVARVRTRLTVHRLVDADGRVLAELADDRVTGEATGAELTTSTWRELEVELVDGDPGLLDAAGDALVRAGATPSAAPSKLARTLGARLDAGADPHPGRPEHTPAARPDAADVVLRYLADNAAALVDQDPHVRLSGEDAVHQMRVATRRLRTTMATFRPLFADERLEPLRGELKWLAGVLGAVRDAEVLRGRLEAEIDEQPTELVLGPVRRRVALELGQVYRDAHAALVAALDSERYLNLLGQLESLVEDPVLSERGTRSADAELSRRVRKACRRVERAADALAGSTTPGTPVAPDATTPGAETGRDHRLHEVRIAAKRARYAAEAARPVAGRRARRLGKAMEEVQEVLGDHQDAVVERAWLRDLGVRAFLAGENGFTFGRLHGLADSRTHHDEARFARVWKRTRAVVSAWPGR